MGRGSSNKFVEFSILSLTSTPNDRGNISITRTNIILIRKEGVSTIKLGFLVIVNLLFKMHSIKINNNSVWKR